MISWSVAVNMLIISLKYARTESAFQISSHLKGEDEEGQGKKKDDLRALFGTPAHQTVFASMVLWTLYSLIPLFLSGFFMSRGSIDQLQIQGQLDKQHFSPRIYSHTENDKYLCLHVYFICAHK